MQLIVKHPMRLRSSWDSYSGTHTQPDSLPQPQPFSTWKFRSDVESKRLIDYIWYVLTLPEPQNKSMDCLSF